MWDSREDNYGDGIKLGDKSTKFAEDGMYVQHFGELGSELLEFIEHACIMHILWYNLPLVYLRLSDQYFRDDKMK